MQKKEERLMLMLTFFSLISMILSLVSLRYAIERIKNVNQYIGTNEIIELEEESVDCVSKIGVVSTTDIELSEDVLNTIEIECEKYGIDPYLIQAIIQIESRGYENADNELCYGLMQLNVQYEDVFIEGASISSIRKPNENIKAGIWFFYTLLEKFDWNIEIALVAYNNGEGKTYKLIRDGITRTSYSESVMSHYNENKGANQ